MHVCDHVNVCMHVLCTCTCVCMYVLHLCIWVCVHVYVVINIIREK